MKVLIPVPDHDFDTTEVAVPWKLLTKAGHEVIFATEAGGARPACDPLLISGVIFGALGAAPEAKAFYQELLDAPEFQRPIAWRDVHPAAFDGLILPGGHAPGMRQYLGSELLQTKAASFWKLARPVGAICHGVLVLARAKDPSTNQSVLSGAKTTCLPKYMERSAYLLTFWKLGRYYRTYDAYVEDEVKSALTNPPAQFERGPRVLSKRGTAEDDGPAFVVHDKNYVSARWPGDAYLFTRTFLRLLES